LINLEKIRHNTEVIVGLTKEFGMEITGVTKATCGDPDVAGAMLVGGATSIGDSRIDNIRKMKEAGIVTDFVLLRTPMLSEAEYVVNWSDISLNSELEVIARLSEVARKCGKRHRIILMVEMGELREGLNREEMEPVARQALEMEGIEVHGIGMNLACLSGVVPTSEKMDDFESFVTELEGKLGVRFTLVGSGNTANLPMMKKPMKGRTNNLRVGEGILLGVETVKRTPIKRLYQDAFILEVEIIELKDKPSMPDGEISQNAFGEKMEFEDRGIITRGIIAVGRQDVIVEGLTPMDPDVHIINSSSDHIVLELNRNRYSVGDLVKFKVNYGALVHLSTSPYVKKIHMGTGE
jgi:predicted amino acid racemase